MTRETISDPVIASGDAEEAEPVGKGIDAYELALLPPFEDEFEPGKEPRPRRLWDAERFGDYVVREWGATDYENQEGKWHWPPAFDILHRGRCVYAESGYASYHIGDCCGQRIAMGSDVNGDGVPDLVVTRCGGGRSPSLVRIFELGPELRLVAERDFYYRAELRDLDSDSVREIVAADDSLALWPDGYSGSPVARVVLRFRDGAYVPAPELMRKGASAIEDWRDRALAVRDDPVWTKSDEWRDGPAELWCYACDLIYAGRGDLAAEFLQLAWPSHVPGWEEFRAELRLELERSPYWPTVAALNGW